MTLIKTIRIISIIAFYSISFPGSAQNTVTGTVSSEDGPLAGVNVMIQGTTVGNITDLDGKYTLMIPDQNVSLIFSYVGYQSVIESINNRTVIDIFMQVDPTQLEEIIITGYTGQSKRNISGAVSVVDPEEINTIPASNITEQLQGRAPGVNVLSSGRPGGTVTVNIRGMSTINDNNPLYIIDGMPADWETVSYLNPMEIESIQVLKDASAASIYGARAANGVIIFTTKKSKGEGETRLSFDAYVGVQHASNLPEMANPDQLAQVIRISLENQDFPLEHPQYLLSDGTWGLPDYVIPDGHSIALDGDVDESLYNYEVDSLRYTRANQSGTKWMDEIFQPALVQNYNLTATGGNEKGQFLLGFGYFDQEGVIIHTNYKRFSATINTLFNIKNRVRIGENFIITYRRATNDADAEMDFNRTGSSSALLMALNIPEILPVYDVGGNFAGTATPGLGGADNPVAYAERNKNNLDESVRLMGSLFLEVDILKELIFKTSFSPNFKLTFEHKYFQPMALESFRPTYNNKLDQYSNNSFNWTWYNTLTYNHTFGNQHNLQVLLGTEAIQDKTTYLTAGRSTYLFEDPSYVHIRSGETDFINDGISEEWSLFSLFAKVDYDYNGKYLVSGTVRRDGSSRFGTGNKYGVFPAFSAAWRISSEPFMSSLSAIDDFKIRFGWGQTGNQNIGNYRIYNTFGLDINSANYDIMGTNNSVVTGFQANVFGNPEAKWETTTSTNIGLDLTLFNNSLTLNFDWYTRLTTDMLVQIPSLGTKGNAVPPFVNIGEMINKGIDLGVSYQSNKARDFSWSTGINFTHYKNEVTELYDSDFELQYGQSITRERQPVAMFYGYKILGIFQNQDEVDNAPFQDSAAPGRWKYDNVNGDTLISEKDRTYVGNPHPDFTFGIPLNFNYRRFYLNLFFIGSYGNDLYNDNRFVTDFIGSWPLPYAQIGTSALEAWGMPGVDKLTAKLPEIVHSYPNIEYSNSSYFVENGSYLRLNQLILGYEFNVSQWKAIEQFRLYVQGNNIFTITNYGGIDPVIPDRGTMVQGVDRQHYPNVRSFMLGFKISF
jgi:TonB-linked SusC/RagA family outer membrane protein